MPGFGRVSKQLICAHCDAVIATATYRPLLSWRLDITSPDGHQRAPLAGSVQLRIPQGITLITEPQIARAMRKTNGTWVSLKETAHRAKRALRTTKAEPLNGSSLSPPERTPDPSTAPRRQGRELVSVRVLR